MTLKDVCSTPEGVLVGRWGLHTLGFRAYTSVVAGAKEKNRIVLLYATKKPVGSQLIVGFFRGIDGGGYQRQMDSSGTGA